MVYEEVANSSAPKLANLPAPLTSPVVGPFPGSRSSIRSRHSGEGVPFRPKGSVTQGRTYDTTPGSTYRQVLNPRRAS